MEREMSPIGRVSWASVFGEGDPKAQGKSKFRMTLMLPKNKEAIQSLGFTPAKADAYLAKVEAFIEKVKEEGKALAESKWKGKSKSTRWNPVIDGDDKSDSFAPNANFHLLRMSTMFQPAVQAAKKTDGMIADGNDDTVSGFYSGCWARCYVSMYTYNADGNKGVGLGLGAIQKAYNDEPFMSVTETFDDDIEDIDSEDGDFGDLE